MADTLLRLQKVLDRTGFKRSKLYSLIDAGKFPKPMKVDGCAMWPESVVDEWIDARVKDYKAATVAA